MTTPQATPQGSSQGMTQGAPQATSHGSPQGSPQAAPQSTPQTAPQATSQGIGVWEKCLQLMREYPTVTEITSNGPGSFYMKSDGQVQQLNVPEMSQEDYIVDIETYLVPQVQTPNEYNRLGFLFEGGIPVGARMARCHIVLPPVSTLPVVTLTRKLETLVSLEELQQTGAFTVEMLEFLRAAVRSGATIVISGGTGAGKTTFLEALAAEFPNELRIGVAEDIKEIQLSHPNTVYLQSFPLTPGVDPNNVASLSWVVQQLQRMRVNRIIIGETRGKEFADFIVAANSGLEGSLTTIHASSPTRCLEKMFNFVALASPRPHDVIASDIGNAVHLIVQLEQRSGSHYVMAIAEVIPTVSHKGQLGSDTLYEFNGTDFVRRSHISSRLRGKFSVAGYDPQQF